MSPLRLTIHKDKLEKVVLALGQAGIPVDQFAAILATPGAINTINGYGLEKVVLALGQAGIPFESMVCDFENTRARCDQCHQ